MQTISIKNNKNKHNPYLTYSEVSGIKDTINNKNNTADKPAPYNPDQYTFGKVFHKKRNISLVTNITNTKKVKLPTNNTSIQIKQKFNNKLNNSILYNNNNKNIKITLELKQNTNNNTYNDNITPTCITITNNDNNYNTIKSIKENTINNISKNNTKFNNKYLYNNNKLIEKQQGTINQNKISEEHISPYTYNSNSKIDWYNYANKIYLLHSKSDNQRTLNNLNNVGITDYTTIYYKTELQFNDYKYYKTAALLDAIDDAYKHKLDNILILTDDIKFIDDDIILKNCLDSATKHDISVLNPDDIANDCLFIKKNVIQFIHNLNIDKSKLNYKTLLKELLLNKYTIYNSPSNICLHLIDFLLPYVDCNDKEWIDIHNKHNKKTESNVINRFQSFDNLLYVFKSILKNASFIDNVYLIVMCDSLVPSWVNKEYVNIIYHKDFIPEEKLPCFSSTLIESYITNIKDLSEYFLYSNDDLFIVNKTYRKDWYTDGLPNLSMCRFTRNNDQFARNAIRSWKFATLEFKSNNNSVYRTNHSINPLLKSTGIHLHDLYKKQIDESASMFRSEKDFNQYIYTDYIYKLCNCELKSNLKTKYVSLYSAKSLLNIDLNKYHIFCPNDCIKNQNNFELCKNKLLEVLHKYINIDSKYELKK